MKKQIVLLAAAALATAATMAFGASGSIVGTAHDLSQGSNSKGADEICIYCHTPHNPVQAIPLWNRVNPSGALFSLYKTSPTLTSSTKNASFSDTSVSLFCMSCHDGVTALGAIKNSMNHSMTSGVISNTRGDRLGQNLTNSHPVGFDYNLAASADTTLFPIGSAASNLGSTTGGSYPFFNSDLTTGSMMECASCHKVHNDEYGKFLRKDNTGSNLCIACHNK